jgi:class 3 adenylate cyclase
MQLMLALYRCGRQAEALAEYGHARRALVDALGIEPSPPLQLLERRILNHDPKLEGPAQRPVARAAEKASAPPERRLVTVVFADLGVSMPPTRDPERLAAFVADVRETAARELETAGGTVERGVADAVLAAFGSPAAHEGHAIRAAGAALALLEALDDRFGATVAPRVGVETGEVVVEPTGHAVGEPVMAAGALLRRARPGEALAGPRAAATARAVFALRATPHGFLLAGRREATAERERRARGLRSGQPRWRE